MGKPTGNPGKLERAGFPQYWPFPASPCRRAVNQKDKEFVVGLFGSANVPKFEVFLMREGLDTNLNLSGGTGVFETATESGRNSSRSVIGGAF